MRALGKMQGMLGMMMMVVVMMILLLLMLHVVRCAHKLCRARHCRLLLCWGWEGQMRQ